ncbi:MAG TPA: hypothetical protein VFO79_15830, partial [Xanthomonadales bacterium]|nr:hypothetical protein [Xanthomonadales bacterium]
MTVPVASGIAAVHAALAAGDADAGFVQVDALLRDFPASPRVHLLAAALHAEEGFGDAARAHAAAAVARARGELPVYSAWLSLLKLGEPIDPAAFADAHRVFGRWVEACRTYRRASPVRGPLRMLVAGLDAHIALVRFLPGILDHVPHGVAVGVASLDPALLESCRRRWPAITCLHLSRDPQAQIEATLAFAPDVLVDLAGHGPNNVLHLLAARCAPVQVTWLDYLATTGMGTVDGRITDLVADPPGNEAWHSEALWRLPAAPWSYEPWPQALAAPRLPSGPIRLGCACVPAKLNASSLSLFARVLASIAGATLTLVGFRSRRAVARVRELFGPVLSPRVECLPRMPVGDYLALVSSYDVALDTIGFSGGTSTLDALSHGVPVVTLPLALSHTRSSASLLASLGMPELVAPDEAGYVAAVHACLSADRSEPARRAMRRARLRDCAVG